MIPKIVNQTAGKWVFDKLLCIFNAQYSWKKEEGRGKKGQEL
ncbi:MAG: hypothetical protein AAFV71_12060 [Cyanobacteria bacterium J06633_8]